MKNQSGSVVSSVFVRIVACMLAVVVAAAMGLATPAVAQADTGKNTQPVFTTGKDQGAAPAGPTSQAAKSTKKAKTKVYWIRSAKDWRNISKYNGGTFKLKKNIKLPNEKYYLTINKNKKYTIDLNGHTVKTAYTGVALRTVAPLYIKKGTVVIKTSNKKGKGVLYGTETVTILAEGKSKLYIQSGSIVNNATEFRSDITSAIMLNGKAKCYLQGKSKVQSIGNGIALLGSSRLYATGNPWVRAGANEYKGQFKHYGSGISIASKTARVSLKGGSYGTKASPDIALWSPAVTMTYAQSANYPILDQYGFALDPNSTLKSALKGYKVVDAKGQEVAIRGSNLSDYYNGVTAPSWSALIGQFGFKEEQRYTTTVTDVLGYYTVYIKKK